MLVTSLGAGGPRRKSAAPAKSLREIPAMKLPTIMSRSMQAGHCNRASRPQPWDWDRLSCDPWFRNIRLGSSRMAKRLPRTHWQRTMDLELAIQSVVCNQGGLQLHCFEKIEQIQCPRAQLHYATGSSIDSGLAIACVAVLLVLLRKAAGPGKVSNVSDECRGDLSLHTVSFPRSKRSAFCNKGQSTTPNFLLGLDTTAGLAEAELCKACRQVWICTSIILREYMYMCIYIYIMCVCVLYTLSRSRTERLQGCRGSACSCADASHEAEHEMSCSQPFVRKSSILKYNSETHDHPVLGRLHSSAKRGCSLQR